MTKKEMLRIKKGDRVRFSDGVEGVVIATNIYNITVDWDDGQMNCGVSVEDGKEITRV